MSDGTLLSTTISVPVFRDSIITEVEFDGTFYPIQIVPKNTQYIIYDTVNITPESFQLPIIFTRTPYDKNGDDRSEEHTSELQSRPHLVCRLLLEKKKKK